MRSRRRSLRRWTDQIRLQWTCYYVMSVPRNRCWGRIEANFQAGHNCEVMAITALSRIKWKRRRKRLYLQWKVSVLMCECYFYFFKSISTASLYSGNISQVIFCAGFMEFLNADLWMRVVYREAWKTLLNQFEWNLNRRYFAKLYVPFRGIHNKRNCGKNLNLYQLPVEFVQAVGFDSVSPYNL